MLRWGVISKSKREGAIWRVLAPLSAVLIGIGGMGCGGAQEKPEGAEVAKGARAGDGEGEWSVSSTKCDASAAMPAPVKERQVREGPVMARVAWGIDKDGSRYEIACFDGPELTTDADRAGLIGLIEGRIANTPGVTVTGRQTARVVNLEAVELELSMPEERVGRYWIFLLEGRRLFEVSVVGPVGDRLVAGSERFFGSFRLARVSPPR